MIEGGITISIASPKRSTSRSDVPTGPLEIGVRPENLEICAPDDPIAVVSGTVQLLERLGSSTTVYVETLLGLLCIQTDSESLAALGDTVGISFDISRAHLFSNDGQAI